MNINKTMAITVTPFPNGGYIVEQVGTWPSPPGVTPAPNKVGAFTTAEDLLMALGETLMPPVATLDELMHEKELEAEGWRPINTAPRDVWVKIRDDEGGSRTLKFHEPYWWTTRSAGLRILDGATPTSDLAPCDVGLLKATHWKPI